MAISDEQNTYNTFRTGQTSLTYDECDDNREDAGKTSQTFRTTLLQAQAILGAMLGVLGGAISSAAVQILSGTIPEFELNAWRFGMQWVIMIPIVMYKGCKLKVSWKTVPSMGLNILLLNAINIFMFTAYIYIPLGLADGLMNAVIIAGNAVLSICIKNDRKLTLYIGAAVCIIGLVLMMQPPFLFSWADLPPPPLTNWTSPCKEIVNDRNMTMMGYISTTPDTIGYVCVVITSACFIAYFHSTGKLVEAVDPFTYSVWSAMLGTIFSIALTFIFEEPTFLESGFCIALLFIHCIGSAGISFANAWSLQYISPSVCALINTLKMVIMVGFQYTMLRDVKPGLHNWVEILGAMVCFVGMLAGPLTEMIHTRY